MILTVTLNPAVDKTVEINDFQAGQVNRISKVRKDAGGKGINVSKVIRSLGGRSLALGILGGTNGRFVKEYLDQLEIESEFCFIAAETRTNIKIVDPSGKINTDINEPGPELSSYDIDEFERIMDKHLDENTVIVLSGSVPSGVKKDIYAKWIKKAKLLGAKAILDADGELLKNGIKEGPYLVKPNIHELEELFGTKINSIEQAEQLGRSLLTDYGIELVVISIGAKGALYINRDVSLLAHALEVDVKSTVGAGDSLVAALAFALEREYGFEKAVRLSMAAGIANVMTSGSQAADHAIILELEGRITFEPIR